MRRGQAGAVADGRRDRDEVDDASVPKTVSAPPPVSTTLRHADRLGGAGGVDAVGAVEHRPGRLGARTGPDRVGPAAALDDVGAGPGHDRHRRGAARGRPGRRSARGSSVATATRVVPAAAEHLAAAAPDARPGRSPGPRRCRRRSRRDGRHERRPVHDVLEGVRGRGVVLVAGEHAAREVDVPEDRRGGERGVARHHEGAGAGGDAVVAGAARDPGGLVGGVAGGDDVVAGHAVDPGAARPRLDHVGGGRADDDGVEVELAGVHGARRGVGDRLAVAEEGQLDAAAVAAGPAAAVEHDAGDVLAVVVEPLLGDAERRRRARRGTRARSRPRSRAPP